jgi:hypothetical protein
MPASLYRLANRPHHSEVSARTQNVQTTVEPVIEQAQVIATELVNEQPAEVQTAAVSEVLDAQTIDHQDSEPVVNLPVWETSWTRSQLFQVASSAGLSVSSTSTKSEIIALLTALSKS